MQMNAIEWVKIGQSTFAGLIAMAGITWCLFPQAIVAGYRSLLPRNISLDTAKSEREIRSFSGRLCGVMFFVFGCFMLYKLIFSGEF